jgi:ankyrin repeat protein
LEPNFSSIAGQLAAGIGDIKADAAGFTNRLESAYNRVRAAYEEHKQAVSDLLLPQTSSSSSGADIDAPTCLGQTALSCAAQFGAREIAAVLLEAGADPNSALLVDAARPLDLAVASLMRQVACLLIDKGAEVCINAQQAAAGRL